MDYLDQNEQYDYERAGDSELSLDLDFHPGVGGFNHIVEATGRWGKSGIDYLELRTLLGGGAGVARCGGNLGCGMDLTPVASEHGPCVVTRLVARSSTTLQSLTLTWHCLGVPDIFY